MRTSSVFLPHERKAVSSLAALYCFRMFGLFMLLPVLAVYGSQYADHSPFTLGLALGAYGLSQAFFQIPFGMMSDKYGRKPLILGGLIIFILGSVVAATADNVYELIIGRFLQGCGAISAAVMALLTDLTSDENRTKAMASIGASIGISFAVAMTLGPLLAAYAGVSSIFWLTALLGLIGIYILVKRVPEVAAPAPAGRDVVAAPHLIKTTLFHSELARLNLGIFVLHFVLMATFVVLPDLLHNQVGIDKTYHGLVYFPLLVIAFVLMVPFVIVAEKRRKIKPVFLLAIVLLVLSELLLLIVGTSQLLALVALFIFFFAFNILEATQPSLVSKIAPAGTKGTATGVYATCQVLGVFGGGALGGYLLTYYSASSIYVVSSIMIGLWLLVALGMSPPKFLASVMMPLDGRDPPNVRETLLQVEGVEDAVVVLSENMIYLKVDHQLVDRNALVEIVENLPKMHQPESLT